MLSITYEVYTTYICIYSIEMVGVLGVYFTRIYMCVYAYNVFYTLSTKVVLIVVVVVVVPYTTVYITIHVVYHTHSRSAHHSAGDKIN